MSLSDCPEYDFLNMSNNKKIIKMLHKNGNNHPIPEHVILSAKLFKINRKGKEQRRILLITNKAIYNVKPNKLGSCQRRIMVASIASITSSESHEFTLNIPSEYDYRYKSVNATQKDHIITTVTLLYGKMTGLNLNILTISDKSTEKYTVTRPESKQKSYAEKYERRKELTRNNNSHSSQLRFVETITNKNENTFGEYPFYNIDTMDWSDYSLITPSGAHLLLKQKIVAAGEIDLIYEN